MKCTGFIQGTISVVALVFTTAPGASAKIPIEVQPCRKGIASSSRSFVQRSLSAIQKCNNAARLSPNGCPSPGAAPIVTMLEQRLRDGLSRSCGSIPAILLGPGYLNYPGPCSDATPSDGFTLADLQECFVTSHDASVNHLIDVEYSTSNQMDNPTYACQKAISQIGGKFVVAELKALQKCRNAVDRGTLTILPEACATDDAKTVAKITAARSSVRVGIGAKCTPTAVATLGVCSNPACASFCGTCDPSCVAECILATHGDAANTLATDVNDLIDFEYPPPPPPPTCGDGSRNQTAEECDGADDGNCPGQCGTQASAFPCLCLNTPRERVIEHANTDLDTGWTGLAHDFNIVEGGGYFLDLFDCDGPQGPDTLCTVGPSCSGAPHPPCSNNAQCSTLSLGTCRKTAIAVGPHCNLDIQQTCTCDLNSTTAQPACIDQTNCPGTGNFCMQQFHTPPLPLSAGGVPVCVVNVFTEDVVGTRDLATGATALRLRQKSIVQMTGTPAQPCPVCGGFCKAAPGDLGNRHNCTTNADCADTPMQACETSHVCSFGPNQGLACRPDPPFGGPTPLFGNPSIDCPPTLSSAGILDIVFNPQTTETVSLQPSIACSEAAFSGKTCVGGGNQGANCTTGSQCPGGTCSFQCFCPVGVGVREQPNGCDAACVGGLHDAESCTFDSECIGGFCHLADCRADPSAPPASQPNEGGCTATVEGRCSFSSYQGCLSDADCSPANCALCKAGETCSVVAKDCYINSGITRSGVASQTDPVLSAIFCIAGTGQSAVDSTAGLPGPGAIRQTSTVVDTGF